MAPTPLPKQTPQQVTTDLTWKLNNLETKVRINEQNIMNDRRHVQLINTSILDLKKELREKTGNVLQEKHGLLKRVSGLELKMEHLERRLKRFARREELATLQKFHKSFNYFDNEMTKDEADHILDDIVRKAEA